MKYVLYARKSSEDKSRQIQSIDDQIDAMKEIARLRNLQIVDIITDEKSAKSPGRPGFLKLIQKIQQGEVQGVLCWKLDRLSRNPVDAGTMMWMLQNEHILEIVTPEKICHPHDNAVLLSFEFGMATQVIRELSVNVKRGMESKVAKGWMPGKVPLGYKNDPYAAKGTKRIFPDEEVFPILQRLWQMLLKEHCTLSHLYSFMREECPIFRHGSPLAFSTFCRVFSNRFYCGQFKWDGEWHAGKHEPMISLREFDQAQEILGRTTKLRDRSLIFDFKGLFRCKGCGATITAEHHPKRNKTTGEMKDYRYYRCAHRKKGIPCKEKPISESAVEKAIAQAIERCYIPEEIVRFGLSLLQQDAAISKESFKEQQLTKAMGELKQRIKTVENNLAEESDPTIRADMKRRANELKIELQGLTQELEKTQQDYEAPYTEITSMLELLTCAKEKFAHGTTEERRGIVRGLGSNWEVAAQALVFKPHFVALATEKAMNDSRKEILRFEPRIFDGIQRKTLPQEVIDSVWSG